MEYSSNILILPGALVINPITWTTDETLATTAEGLGSYMPDSAGVYSPVPQCADARVDLAKGALICSTIDKSLGYGPGIFHVHDYSFYYFNLRANAANRVREFLKK